MTVGLVVVSHSRALARAAVTLAREMVPDAAVPLEIAAGLDETTLGTDATAIAAAVAAADRGSGVVVLMDLGSAVLSAELALELLDDAIRERALLCPAPLVEGLVVAAVTAAGGASRAEVAAEATAALGAKLAQLGGPAAEGPAAGPDPVDAAEEPAGTFTVSNPHGLHARPAARLVQAARATGARITLRNRTTGSPWVAAGSLSQVAALGALRGHEVEVRASGPDARAALDGLLALAARAFDEAAPGPDRDRGADVGGGADSGSPPDAARPGPIAASPGVVVGPARPSGATLPDPDDVPAGDPAAERARLGAALDTVRREVTRLRVATARDVGTAEAAIFDAHLLLLDDPGLLDDAHARIDAGAAAGAAWSAATGRAGAELAALPDPYQQARAADVAALADQVLRALSGRSGPDASAAGVLVASDLTPAQAAGLDAARVQAVVLAFGSPAAHSAILLRARGIPAVVAAGAGILGVADGTTLAVDGGRGELVVDPPADVRARFEAGAAERALRQGRALAAAGAPAVTRDGVEVPVAANVGSVADARAAAAGGADLAGLVRTEFLFLGRDAAPDVGEQEAVYREIAEALGGRRVTLRTLDVGGDKPLPYLPMPAEANPFLGVRGIRLSMARPELLADQLLAMARVARDVPVSVMFPMIGTLEELLWARRMLDDAIARDGRGAPPGLEVGMMVEVPAAALRAVTFAPHVDFFSIGTNDLTQYALAAERGNAAVAGLGDPLDPGVLRLVDAVCRTGVPTAVCGELAADERATPLLLGLGVGELSVAPPAVPAIKEAVRAADRGDGAALAEAALTAVAAADVRRSLADPAR